jgi:hypothetical protein
VVIRAAEVIDTAVVGAAVGAVRATAAPAVPVDGAAFVPVAITTGAAVGAGGIAAPVRAVSVSRVTWISRYDGNCGAAGQQEYGDRPASGGDA